MTAGDADLLRADKIALDLPFRTGPTMIAAYSLAAEGCQTSLLASVISGAHPLACQFVASVRANSGSSEMTRMLERFNRVPVPLELCFSRM